MADIDEFAVTSGREIRLVNFDTVKLNVGERRIITRGQRDREG